MTGRGAVPGLGPRSEGDRDFASHTAANAKRLEESRVKLSIVIPIYNEAANLDEFFRRLLEVLERLAVSYEVVCVDDGSTDETLARLIERRARDPRLKILSLSRNFGKEVALSAGIEHSSGAAVIPIDCDLPDPPELIEEMVAQWRLGYDVVYATRHSRPGDGLAKRLSARMFYRLLDAVSEVPIPSDAGDFRLLDRRVVDALLRLPERSRFMKGLFAWVGFKQTELSFEREGSCVDLLAAVELRARRGHLVQFIAAKDLELCRGRHFAARLCLRPFPGGVQARARNQRSRLHLADGGPVVSGRHSTDNPGCHRRISGPGLHRGQTPAALSVARGARIRAVRRSHLTRG